MPSTFQGRKGFLSLGGYVNAYGGTPLNNGSIAQGATVVNLDRNGAAIHGVLLPGDKFTVAGDAQVYTVVTGGAFVGNVLNSVTFAPGVVPAGGWADNAALTLVVNTMAEIRSWSCSLERAKPDRTVLTDKSKRYEFGQLDFRGRAQAFLDYDDLVQKKAIDETTAENPALVGLVLVIGKGDVAPDTKLLYGVALVEQFQTSADKENLIPVDFDFQGSLATGLALVWH